jgi:chaperonin GroES
MEEEKEKEKDLKKLIVVGDRVLIKPRKLPNKSKGGLLLPPGYQEKEELQTGYVLKCGPGYPIPVSPDESSESWKGAEDQIRYIPLQAQIGDTAIFLQKGAIEIIYNDERYFIVPQNSILLLERDEALFD